MDKFRPANPLDPVTRTVFPCQKDLPGERLATYSNLSESVCDRAGVISFRRLMNPLLVPVAELYPENLRSGNTLAISTLRWGHQIVFVRNSRSYIGLRVLTYLRFYVES